MSDIRPARPTPSALGIAGYGVGDLGLNIYWNTLSLVLVFWYVEVVGLDPTTAGFIYFVGLVWDGISDPVVATLTARTRTRLGTYRPYLLFGGPMLGLSFTLLFWRPELSGAALIVWLCLAHILFRTSYTLVAVPYSALSTRISLSSKDRTLISGIRMGFAFSGLLIVSLGLFPLVRLYGDGTTTGPYGYLMAAAIGGVLATLILWTCFATTTELPPLGTEPDSRANLRKSLNRLLARNSGMPSLLTLISLQAAASATLGVSLTFFIDMNADRLAPKEAVLTAFAVATLVSIPIWTLLMRVLRRKIIWTLATALTLLGGLTMATNGLFIIAGQPVQLMLIGFGTGAIAILVWALIPDMVDYAQWKTGVRSEGLFFGSVLLFQKFSGGLVGLGFGYFLAQLGYDAQADVQTLASIEGITLFLGLAPATLLTLACVVLWTMPLNQKLHYEIVQSLSHSRADAGRNT